MIQGSIVAIVTPMFEDGSLDFASLRALLDWHVAGGTNAIVIVGTTGESPTVDVQEHCEIIRVAVEQAAKRVPIMAARSTFWSALARQRTSAPKALSDA